MILLCYDGSPSAKHAITSAHAIVGQSPATLLHIWEPPANFLGPDPFGGIETWSGPQIVELEAMALERANRTVEYGVELARDAGFSADGRLERADTATWRAILDIADGCDAQLIVVGARGLSPLESVLIGSVSNALVHHSSRPVLVVPSEPAETKDAKGTADEKDSKGR
jgi:nucleotide-binding universal stress UspA family protein